MFGGSKLEIEVSLRMVDGTVARGSINPGLTPTLDTVLNKDSQFIEFTSKDGQRRYVSKSQIAAVEPVEPFKKPNLPQAKPGQSNDYYAILGLKPGCSLEDARTAFLNKAKLYHPDKFSGIELPDEVTTYMNAMFRQINTAFTELRAELAPNRQNQAAV